MVRRVLVSLGAGLLLVACGEDASPPKQDARDFFFYVSADPQINVPEWGLAGLDTMVATMNRTPGREWPFGGRVDTPRDVIVPGDLVDDIDHSQNWDAYKKYFDPEGNATLRFPVFAEIGNHDLSDSTAQQFSYVERAHIRRNERRPAPLNLGVRRAITTRGTGRAFTSFAPTFFRGPKRDQCTEIRPRGTTQKMPWRS